MQRVAQRRHRVKRQSEGHCFTAVRIKYSRNTSEPRRSSAHGCRRGTGRQRMERVRRRQPTNGCISQPSAPRRRPHLVPATQTPPFHPQTPKNHGKSLGERRGHGAGTRRAITKGKPTRVQAAALRHFRDKFLTRFLQAGNVPFHRLDVHRRHQLRSQTDVSKMRFSAVTYRRRQDKWCYWITYCGWSSEGDSLCFSPGPCFPSVFVPFSWHYQCLHAARPVGFCTLHSIWHECADGRRRGGSGP